MQNPAAGAVVTAAGKIVYFLLCPHESVLTIPLVMWKFDMTPSLGVWEDQPVETAYIHTIQQETNIRFGIKPSDFLFCCQRLAFCFFF